MKIVREVDMLDQPTAVIVGALLGFIGGMMTIKYTYEQKSDELFFKALDFLKEGSQNRNLGISAIEIYWNNRRHRDLCVALLAGSAVYLINESKQGEAAHELNNLRRIMVLLLGHKKPSTALLPHYSSVQKAICDYKSGKRVGLTIDEKTLNSWEASLKTILISGGSK